MTQHLFPASVGYIHIQGQGQGQLLFDGALDLPQADMGSDMLKSLPIQGAAYTNNDLYTVLPRLTGRL
jgi:hypothetical protein